MHSVSRRISSTSRDNAIANSGTIGIWARKRNTDRRWILALSHGYRPPQGKVLTAKTIEIPEKSHATHLREWQAQISRIHMYSEMSRGVQKLSDFCGSLTNLIEDPSMCCVFRNATHPVYIVHPNEMLGTDSWLVELWSSRQIVTLIFKEMRILTINDHFFWAIWVGWCEYDNYTPDWNLCFTCVEKVTVGQYTHISN